MSEGSKIIVLKFGSSVLRSEADCPRVIGEIYRHVRDGNRVVAVVSAFKGETDRLTKLAIATDESPDETSLTTFLATGELRSAALLTIHLHRAGLEATLADQHRLGLVTKGPLLHADPVGVNRDAIHELLAKSKVLVVPGFVGVHPDGRTALLGRGGSDLTAIFLAGQLKADRCVLIKDVDGLYDHDPNEARDSDDDRLPKRFHAIPFGLALQLEAPLVQVEAIANAKHENRTFEVGCLNAQRTTCIGADSVILEEPDSKLPPLRISLLGCGHVGQAVVEQLSLFGDAFEIVGVGVRDPFKSRSLNRDVSIEFEFAETVLQRDTDVLVELIGGINPARTYLTRALQSGWHVITANKQLMARHGVALLDLARRSGSTLNYSASVGGGVPMIEVVRRAAESGRITRVRGVLNGTCNFILERLEQSDGWCDALELAQRRGLAEANASFDLDGLDAAHKIIILAREAFGVELSLATIPRQCLEESVVRLVLELKSEGKHLRQVAECSFDGERIEARIGLVALDSDDPLKPRHEVGNALELHDANGLVRRIQGVGAGGGSTANSVIADLLEISRNRDSSRLRSSPLDSRREVAI